MGHYSKDNHYTSDRWSGFERQRVDVGQTAFFEGRQFRSYYEFSIGAGNTLVGKFVSPVDFILSSQKLNLDVGGIRLSAHTGGTEGGTFTPLPIIGKNRMAERRAPYYVPQATISVGGTHSGGTELDAVRLVAPGVGSNTSTLNGGDDDERGLPAGTYYIRLANISGTATGVYSLWWEERARHPNWRLDELKT